MPRGMVLLEHPSELKTNSFSKKQFDLIYLKCRLGWGGRRGGRESFICLFSDAYNSQGRARPKPGVWVLQLGVPVGGRDAAIPVGTFTGSQNQERYLSPEPRSCPAAGSPCRMPPGCGVGTLCTLLHRSPPCGSSVVPPHMGTFWKFLENVHYLKAMCGFQNVSPPQ